MTVLMPKAPSRSSKNIVVPHPVERLIHFINSGSRLLATFWTCPQF